MSSEPLTVAEAARQRFLHDPAFHALVEHVTALLDTSPQTSDLDVYAALYLALEQKRRYDASDRMLAYLDALRRADGKA